MVPRLQPPGSVASMHRQVSHASTRPNMFRAGHLDGSQL